MNKEHGQVTGIIWRGPDDLAIYQRLKEYADKKDISVSEVAKQLVKIALKKD
ncbi:hypothetical protein [Limosilactobacillus reuteri]|uniref:hypothetical protein n=1 Tax=Limosilactobacillus reuteri TaxID=1598 RepID=UPI002F264453